jgi:hypothetical protein
MKTSLCIIALCLCSVLDTKLLNAQWQKTNGPYGGTPIGCIVANGSNLFGATGDSIYLSTDRGMSWETVCTGLPYDQSYPGVRIICLASNRGSVFAGTYAGVYLSSDDGASWQSVVGGSGPQTTVTAVGFIDSVIIAGTESLGIFRSIDGGVSWKRVDSVNSHWSVSSIVTNGDIVFAGLDGGGLLKSTDLGKTWEHVDSVNNFVNYLMVKNGVIYAGLYRSTDNGLSWVAPNSESGYYVTGLATIGGNIFAGTGYGSGVIVSTDDGTSWKQTNSGLVETWGSDPWIYDLAASGARLFATTRHGLFVSSDTGRTWTITNVRNVGTWVYSIVSDGGTLYAGTDQGFFLSTDNGSDWIATSTGLTSYEVYCIARLDSILFVGTTKGVFRSSDEGKNWQSVNKGLDSQATSVKSLAVKGSDIFATGSHNVYKSSNAGESWVALDSGFTMFDVGSLLAAGGNLFAGAINGVFRSTDDGGTWVPIDSGLTDKYITALLYDGGKLFAGTYLHGVFCLTNEGATWSSLPFVGLSNQHVYSLAAFRDSILFVGGTGFGVLAYSLNDSSLMWGSNQGMSSPPVNSLALQDGYVLAGTYYDIQMSKTFGGGVWRRPLSEFVTDIEGREKQLPLSFRLFQNYPNPFNPTTEIQFSIAKLSIVDLRIFDLLGREVATLVNEQRHGGTYSVKWNAGNLPSGVYFYQLRAGSFVETKKLLVLK